MQLNRIFCSISEDRGRIGNAKAEDCNLNEAKSDETDAQMGRVELTHKKRSKIIKVIEEALSVWIMGIFATIA